MKPVIDDDLRRFLTSSTKHLGITYPTMKRYIESGLFSAEVCLAAERYSKGKVTCNQLRPDLFEDLPADTALAQTCLEQFESLLECESYQLIIGVLNFMETRQPKLYRSMVTKMRSLEGGELFIAQRLAHKNYGKV